jgi:hypothetical protein
MTTFWFTVASAADDGPAPAPDPAPIELAPAEEELPSALDGLDQAHTETPTGIDLEDVLPDWAPDTSKQRLRGQLFARPVLGGVVLPEDGWGLRVGGALGHRMWTMKPGAVSFGTEERVSLTAPIGGAKGYAADASILVGPWLGPVGLRVGPVARLDRWNWGDGVVLDDALGVGVLGDVSVVLGKAVVTAGVSPTWLLTGDRGPASDVFLLGLGDETSWRGGVGWIGRPLQWSLDLEARDTAVGTLWSGGLALQLRFL